MHVVPYMKQRTFLNEKISAWKINAKHKHYVEGITELVFETTLTIKLQLRCLQSHIMRKNVSEININIFSLPDYFCMLRSCTFLVCTPICTFLKLKDVIQKILRVISKLCFNINKVSWFFAKNKRHIFWLMFVTKIKKKLTAFQNKNYTIWMPDSCMYFCKSVKDKILRKKWWSLWMT